MGKENRNYYRKGLTKVPPATQGVSALLHILILIFSIEEFCNIFDSKIFPMQHKSHLASNLRPTHHHFHHQQTLTVSPPKNTFIDPSRYYPESPQKLNFHSAFFFFRDPHPLRHEHASRAETRAAAQLLDHPQPAFTRPFTCFY